MKPEPPPKWLASGSSAIIITVERTKVHKERGVMLSNRLKQSQGKKSPKPVQTGFGTSFFATHWPGLQAVSCWLTGFTAHWFWITDSLPNEGIFKTQAFGLSLLSIGCNSENSWLRKGVSRVRTYTHCPRHRGFFFVYSKRGKRGHYIARFQKKFWRYSGKNC